MNKIAVQMVDLMLQASRQNTLCLDLLGAAVAIKITGAHPGRPFDVLEKFRDRQAALLIGGELLRGPENFRINDTKRGRRGVLVFAFRDVENEDPLWHGNLDRGETDAGRGIHGLEHIVHERADARVDRGHRRAFEAQTRIREGNNRPYSHPNEIIPAPPEVNLSPPGGSKINLAAQRVTRFAISAFAVSVRPENIPKSTRLTATKMPTFRPGAKAM